tara:strand:- start:708 stop:1295 length:588 start_codon:yes stop_codon:yes gene_type:complete
MERDDDDEVDDEIEEVSDDGFDVWQPRRPGQVPVDRNRPQARTAGGACSSTHPPHAGAGGASTSGGGASAAGPNAHLFPHFTSLACLWARGEPTHIDYLAQCGLGSDGGARPAARQQAGSSAADAAIGSNRARGRGKGGRGGAGGGKKRKQPSTVRNAWRTVGGKRVWYDADGKKASGSAAFRKAQAHDASIQGS